jgi:hypothetical protein
LGGKGCEYSIETQTNLFCALIGLYNFGKQHGEDLFEGEAVNIQDSRGEVDEVARTGNTWIIKNVMILQLLCGRIIKLI